MVPDLSEVRFNALRNALYHKARQRALEFCDRSFNLTVILLGTAIAATLFKKTDAVAGWWSFLNGDNWLGLATTLVGALQLVYNPGGRAKTHEFLQKQFYDILSEMDADPNPSELQICRWNSSLTKLYGDQPPVLNALDAIAYNQAAASLGTSADDRLKIHWYHSVFRHVVPFNSAYFPTIGETRLPAPGE